MSKTDKVFTGSIAENYDRYLVPLIFESFAGGTGAATCSERQLRRDRPQSADA